MNYLKKEQTYSLYNPFNRFFFFFLLIKSRKWLGWKLLPFSCCIYIFSFLMVLYLTNDLIEIPAMDFFKEHDKIFNFFFICKL